jgi:DNA-binding protein HU-beta
MNKTDLVAKVAGNSGLSQSQVKVVVEDVLQQIKEGTLIDGKVAIAGFGTFTKFTRKERNGRNPSTGQAMVIPAKDVVKFKPYF